MHLQYAKKKGGGGGGGLQLIKNWSAEGRPGNEAHMAGMQQDSSSSLVVMHVVLCQHPDAQERKL